VDGNGRPAWQVDTSAFGLALDARAIVQKKVGEIQARIRPVTTTADKLMAVFVKNRLRRGELRHSRL
jgi:hypothetical protein